MLNVHGAESAMGGTNVLKVDGNNFSDTSVRNLF